jgi:hypothetical protein
VAALSASDVISDDDDQSFRCAGHDLLKSQVSWNDIGHSWRRSLSFVHGTSLTAEAVSAAGLPAAVCAPRLWARSLSRLCPERELHLGPGLGGLRGSRLRPSAPMIPARGFTSMTSGSVGPGRRRPT